MDDEEKLKLGKGVAFVKSRLKRLSQSDDTWEADFEALPKPIVQTETHYLGMVVMKGEARSWPTSRFTGDPPSGIEGRVVDQQSFCRGGSVQVLIRRYERDAPEACGCPAPINLQRCRELNGIVSPQPVDLRQPHSGVHQTGCRMVITDAFHILSQPSRPAPGCQARECHILIQTMAMW